MSEWYYAVGDQQTGPVPEEQLLALMQAGEVHADDLVWTDTMEDWAPAGTVFDLAAQEPPPEPIEEVYEDAPVETSAPAPPAPKPAVAHPLPGQAAESSVSPLAIASLVASIAGFFTCPVVGVIGVVCGHMALGQIRNDPERFHGKGLAIAGLVLGYLLIIGIVLFVALFIVAAALGAS